MTWRDSSHLLLNTTKSREVLADFSRPRPHLEPGMIKRKSVEVVHTCKYLGVQLDDKRDWTANTEALSVPPLAFFSLQRLLFLILSFLNG